MDKAECEIENLKSQLKEQKVISEKETDKIRKEILTLQDRLKGKDNVIAEHKQEINAYKEERKFYTAIF